MIVVVNGVVVKVFIIVFLFINIVFCEEVYFFWLILIVVLYLFVLVKDFFEVVCLEDVFVIVFIIKL